MIEGFQVMLLQVKIFHIQIDCGQYTLLHFIKHHKSNNNPRYYPEIRLPYICIQMVPTVKLNPYIVNPRLTFRMRNFPEGLKFWQKLYLIFARAINRFCPGSAGVTGCWYTDWHFVRCLTNRYRIECINNWIKWTQSVCIQPSTWSFAPKVTCSNL